jgi:hypothetical protein
MHERIHDDGARVDLRDAADLVGIERFHDAVPGLETELFTQERGLGGTTSVFRRDEGGDGIVAAQLDLLAQFVDARAQFGHGEIHLVGGEDGLILGLT